MSLDEFSHAITESQNGNYLSAGRKSQDGYETFIKIHLDYLLYETMMGRNVNTRPFDQSGIFNSQKIIRYLLRLFSKGDKEIPEIIEKTGFRHSKY